MTFSRLNTTFPRVSHDFFPTQHEFSTSVARLYPDSTWLFRECRMIFCPLKMTFLRRVSHDFFSTQYDFSTDERHATFCRLNTTFPPVLYDFLPTFSRLLLDVCPNFTLLFPDLCCCKLAENTFATLMKASLIPQVPGYHLSTDVSE